LGLKVGDYVVLKEEDIELREDDGSLLFEVAHNMVGKVIKASDNVVAQQIRMETGLPLDSAWALVEFENGAQMMLNPRSKFEKVSVQ
jgi:hypothetical protein